MMQSYLLATFTAARRAASPISVCRGSACYFDLQIIQGSLQVKTPPAACAILRISLGFKQLAPRLACRFGDGLDLLAARAVMRIGLSLESSDVVGMDCGGALRPIRGEIMKQQSKLAGLAVLLSVAAHPAVA